MSRTNKQWIAAKKAQQAKQAKRSKGAKRFDEITTIIKEDFHYDDLDQMLKIINYFGR